MDAPAFPGNSYMQPAIFLHGDAAARERNKSAAKDFHDERPRNS